MGVVMFDKLKAMTALAGLMRDKDRLREAGVRLRAHAAGLRVEGEAGGGAARATADGTLRVLTIELSPALAAGADDRTRERAGALIAEAVNAALDGAKRRMSEAVGREASALGLDGLPIDPAQLGGLLG